MAGLPDRGAAEPAAAVAPGGREAVGGGRAELAGYQLRQPRYGQVRDGTAVLIFVTEDFSDTLRVKADPGKHEARDVYPVLKLNAIRKFQTGIYDYSVMTSVFARVDSPGRPFVPQKISFSSQEWCGHVYHQLLPRGGKLRSHSHSYFDGEADAELELDAPADGVTEDELPIVLRSYAGKPDLVGAGASRSAPFLPSLLRTRLLHQRLAWGRATLAAAPAPETVTVPAGRFAVRTYTIEITAAAEGGARRGTYQIEAAAPHRLIAWRWSDGEEGRLVGSERVSYWQKNAPGGEKLLAPLGLRPMAPPSAVSR